MANLNHLLFGMILNLDIGLLHPSGLLRHKISKKNEKRPNFFFGGHVKDQIEKKNIDQMAEKIQPMSLV